MRPVLSLIAGCAVLTGGCGNSGSASDGVILRDSAGITIVESTPPTREQSRPWAIDSVPLLDIGADPADPRQEFSSPSDPVRLPDGRIAIADHGTQEIRFFDRSGTWLRSVGRKGQGPGEFMDIRELHLGPGDSLYAYEGGTGFVSVFDSAGQYVRRVRLQFAGQGRFAMFRGVWSNGNCLVDGSRSDPPTSAGVFRSNQELFEYSADGAPLDSLPLGTVPGWEAYGEPVNGRGYRFLMMPFRRGSVNAVQGDRVLFGVTERIDLRVYRPGQGLERVIRLRLAERPLTRAMIERAVERMMAGWTRTPVVTREGFRSKILGATYPAAVPAIDALVVAANGDLWFREYQDDPDGPIGYLVTDSTGRFRAFVEGPARFRPSWIGNDLVIGLWRDSDDVPHVRSYRLRK